MNDILNFILGCLEPVFGIPWVAPLLIMPAMLLWTAWICIDANRRTQPYLRAVGQRISAIRTALGDDLDPSAERAAFSSNYLQVSEALGRSGPGALDLVMAWREFHESIIDETDNPIRNTSRPSVYFYRAAPKQTTLVFWSNIMVGIGLILTFLGLIVALHKAKAGMAVNDVHAVQGSLIGLLTVAGAKFFTSVAGVGSSLILRAAEHRLTRPVSQATDKLCGLLEQGLLYVPPQRLAAEQLAELRDQTKQLQSFNTDFALQLSERVGVQFQAAVAPVAASLETLNESMAGMGQSIRDGLGQSAADAVAQATGGELRALGQTLGTLGEKLGGLSGAIGSSGEDASRQIRSAGADFVQAAADIRAAFDQLISNIDGMGEKLSTQSEAVARQQQDVLGRALGGLEAAQSRSTETMTEAVSALREAGADAAATMQRELSATLASGVAESQATFRSALEESGESMRGAASGLTKAVAEAAERIDLASAGIVRAGESAAITSTAMKDVGTEARTAASSLKAAADGFANIAGPVTAAAANMSGASDRLSRAVESGREAEVAALSEIRGLADQIRQTQVAAESAWRDYRARFEGVDQTLERTAVRLGQTLGDSFEEFRKFAHSFDSELSGAVAKLSDGLSAIEEYAEALEDHVKSVSADKLGAAA